MDNNQQLLILNNTSTDASGGVLGDTIAEIFSAASQTKFFTSSQYHQLSETLNDCLTLEEQEAMGRLFRYVQKGWIQLADKRFDRACLHESHKRLNDSEDSTPVNSKTLLIKTLIASTILAARF